MISSRGANLLHWRGAIAVALLAALTATRAGAEISDAETFDGVRLTAEQVHPGVVETWDEMLVRQIVDPPREAPYTPTNPLMQLEYSVKNRELWNPGLDSDVASGVTPRSSTPILISDFIGPDRINDSGTFPPDSMGAVGPTQFVVFINGNVSIYDKSTGMRTSSVSLNTFWGGLQVNGAFDPRVLFDQHTNRWITIAADNGENPNDILVAVSATDNAAGSWFKSKFVASAGTDAGRWADFPTLGVDAEGIYVSANMFPVTTGTSRRTFWVIDKAPMVDSPQSMGTVTAFREIFNGFTLQPSHTYGTPGTHYTIAVLGSGLLRVYTTTGPRNSPTFTSPGTVSVDGFTTPPDAPALGSTTDIDTSDTRLQMAVHRGGSLWTCHTINVGGRAAVRWYEINPATRVELQSGTISDPTRAYFYPSIMVNGDGSAVMSFVGVAPAELVSTYYTGRRQADPADTMGPPTLLKAGETIYTLVDNIGRNRWGDYSYVTLDPTDEDTFWVIAEYAGSPANNWGTWIGELLLSSDLPGDFDGDGDVDTSDFATFAQCFGGSFNPPALTCPAGVDADLDNDGDVDLGDFAIFAQNFTGAQ